MGLSIDREKVIKGLHCCSHTDGVNCIYCPYDTDSDCTALMSMDVLELLKEQDAVAPRREMRVRMLFRCGACGEYVGFIDSDPGDNNEQDNYCRNCGRKVKWNE